MTTRITNESRWSQVVESLKVLNQEKLDLENLMFKEYLKNVTQTFTLPKEARLNWRELYLVIGHNKNNVPEVQLRGYEQPLLLNGRYSKDYPAGTTFLVLKEWKNGKTKGTNYLFYDKKTKRVANFYK